MSTHAAYPPQGQNGRMAPGYTVAALAPGQGLKVPTAVMGIIGLLAWCISTGFLIAWGYGYYSETSREAKILYGNCISIPANVGMIYVTCRILFLMREGNYLRLGTPEDMSRCVSRLIAFSLLSFTGWVSSIVWLSIDNTANFRLYHGCNYGFLLGGAVALLADGLVKGARVAQDHMASLHTERDQATALKHLAPHPESYNNPAYPPPY